jgi:hypothetical protein
MLPEKRTSTSTSSERFITINELTVLPVAFPPPAYAAVGSVEMIANEDCGPPLDLRLSPGGWRGTPTRQAVWIREPAHSASAKWMLRRLAMEGVSRAPWK